jgi:hypothetical protein
MKRRKWATFIVLAAKASTSASRAATSGVSAAASSVRTASSKKCSQSNCTASKAAAKLRESRSSAASRSTASTATLSCPRCNALVTTFISTGSTAALAISGSRTVGVAAPVAAVLVPKACGVSSSRSNSRSNSRSSTCSLLLLALKNSCATDE